MDPNQKTPLKPGQSLQQEKLWTEDDPYKCSPQGPRGDIWENCLAPLRKEDEVQCTAWREEVKNLLIFAGLFSAVVTTFVVDSYTNLQPSSDQRTVDLLSQIAFHLDNSSTTSSASSSPFSPSPSSIRVNALWFMSLVISLTTALLGIVSLQWIREYEHYSGHWTPKQMFEIRNMRHESMKRWFVPQIFTGLPLLLQMAVILFFIGLVDFLYDLYPPAGFPTIVIVSITLFFLVLTTMLPTLQHYTHQCLHSDIPATPFPYKSPQSGVILAMAQWLLLYIYANLGRNFQARIKRLFKFHGEPTIFSHWNVFDWAWVNKRSGQVILNHVEDRSGDPMVSHYDTARGIAYVVANHYCQSNESVALSAYHCFLEQHKSNSALHHWSPRNQYNFYRSLDLRSSALVFVLQLPKSPTPQAADTALMKFLVLFHQHSGSIPGFSSKVHKQQMELWVRMSTALGCPHPQLLHRNKSLRDISLSILFGHWDLSNDILDSDLALQLILLYKRSVMAPINHRDTLSWDLGRVIGTIDSASVPSFVESRYLVETLHITLAERILQSPANSEFARDLGYWFIRTLFERGALSTLGSLPGWSESYKEAFSFLVTAVYKTMDECLDNFSGTIPGMKCYLDDLSPNMRNCIAQRCKDLAPGQSEALESPDPQNMLSVPKPALENLPIDEFTEFKVSQNIHHASERSNAKNPSLFSGTLPPSDKPFTDELKFTEPKVPPNIHVPSEQADEQPTSLVPCPKPPPEVPSTYESVPEGSSAFTPMPRIILPPPREQHHSVIDIHLPVGPNT